MTISITRAPLRALVLAVAPLAVGVTCASAPASPSEPPRYSAAHAALTRDGRAVAQLVRAGDGAAVFARFGPALERSVPRAEVDRVLRTTLASAPMGRRVAESALPASASRRLYAADYQWGSRRLGLQVVFDANAAIVAIDASLR